jgi:putative FmdB family regulatory protein
VPLYEYKCMKCGRLTEKIESVSGPHLKKCPHCGGKVESLISAPAIQFKGSGWYVTDYAGKSGGGDKSEKSQDKDDKSSTTDKKEPASKDSVSKDSAPKDSSNADKKSEKPKKK